MGKKIITIVGIQLILATLHIIGPGRHMSGIYQQYYYAYFSDFALPCGFYFLMCLSEPGIPFLRHWFVKAGFIFILASTCEILQAFGVYALGTYFDPVDFVFYAGGVLTAAMLETQVFKRFIPYWNIDFEQLKKELKQYMG